MDLTNTTRCTCPSPYTGQFCTSAVCLNGGTFNGTVCKCLPAFTGPVCETQIAIPDDPSSSTGGFDPGPDPTPTIASSTGEDEEEDESSTASPAAAAASSSSLTPAEIAWISVAVIVGVAALTGGGYLIYAVATGKTIFGSATGGGAYANVATGGPNVVGSSSSVQMSTSGKVFV